MKRPLVAGLLIGAAAGVGAGLVQRGRRPSSASSVPINANTFAGRNLRLARLGARAGGREAVARAQGVFASAERREVLDRSVELRHAEDVVRELGAMKGALMKLGQMVSYLDEGLPEHVRTALAQLQQDAPPMSVELAAEMVVQELGARPEVLFAEWDPEPIAAASIGQVHRALTHDGRAVAVKVQYPGIAEAVESDLGNVGLLFGGIGRAYPGFESGPLVEELRTRLREELDYRLEATRQQRFADYYADHPFIHVPGVLPELSARCVLTTELAEGVRFSDAEQWSQEQRDLAGEAIFRFVFRSFYRLRLFNGDPHPGNYLFRPDGRDVPRLRFGQGVRAVGYRADPAAHRDRRARSGSGAVPGRDGACRIPAAGRAGERRGCHRVLRSLLRPYARARAPPDHRRVRERSRPPLLRREGSVRRSHEVRERPAGVCGGAAGEPGTVRGAGGAGGDRRLAVRG